MNLGMVFKVMILSIKIHHNLWYGDHRSIVCGKTKKHVHQRKSVNQQFKLLQMSTSTLPS